MARASSPERFSGCPPRYDTTFAHPPHLRRNRHHAQPEKPMRRFQAAHAAPPVFRLPIWAAFRQPETPFFAIIRRF
ncbi:MULTISPECIES: hypothetical protein [Kingella]|uniref:Uncharacterized protein n=1 Tax=Kingella bonacorsii TaxID=2796361 RepID=A0ABS1BW36_9NEIS|nr:hypothetical protein [Kingella bonacorsii]MBK0397075.1 hypothetical protein [Kingella bonacorsii]